MNTLLDWLRNSLQWAAWVPVSWNRENQWPNRISAALISLACLVIAFFLVVGYLKPWKKRVVPYKGILWLIASFFLLCGGSRMLDVIALEFSGLLDSMISLAMATAAWTTVFALVQLVRRTPGPCNPVEFEREPAQRQRAEGALRKSEQFAHRLALMASRTDNMVIITDDQARIEWTNEGFTRVTGYTLGEVLGRTPGSFLHGPETDSDTAALIRERIRRGLGFQAEILNYGKSGRKYWVNIDVQPVQDELGELINFIAVENEITGRKRAERRMEAKHATMQILADCSRLEQAIPRLLSAIGRMLDFDVGEFWLVDHDAGVLRLAGSPWTSPRVDTAWTYGAQEVQLAPGMGLIGKVWATSSPAWAHDLSREQFSTLERGEMAANCGLRCAFGIPVVLTQAGPVIGVVTFLSREPLERDELLLQAMNTLGSQIGLFAGRWRAEAELMRVNARLNALLDASTQVSIIATDPRGLITVFNPGAERMLGYTAVEMVGKTSPMILHLPEEVEALAARLAAEFGRKCHGFDVFIECARSEGHEVGEWTYVRKDGVRISVLLAVTAVKDPEGRIGGYLGIATDVSARQVVERRLRDSEARFRRLVEANIFGVVFGDIHGNITDANDAFLDMVGYRREEMWAGHLQWDVLIPPNSVAQLQRCRLDLQRRGLCAPFEIDCRRMDGQIVPVLLGVALLDEEDANGSSASVVGFCLDVSERKRLENELRDRASELANADARKNEFLAMLGHELRNPLAPVRNAVKIMKQRGMEDPALCWARDVIDHQVGQMSQLVDDLLEISRVTRGKVRLQKEVVEVGTIVAYAVETSRPIIDSHRHRLTIAIPPTPLKVLADQVRMAQALSNLLNNAAKYTDEGGLIRLSVAIEGAEAVFRVRDNGIGIPPEMLSRVFDLFTQVDRSLDRSQGGLGLGLTLVKSMVEMHGGTVQAVSEGPLRGSEFVVRLPVWEARDEWVPPEESPASQPSQVSTPHLARSHPGGRTVLVVDDNVSSARSLAMVLTLEGYEVQVAHDGPAALEAVRGHRHDAILMDIGLPGMTGYEVACRIRKQPALAPLLLVAVTGYAEDEARRRSREAGFDHHLVKPVDPDAILALLASLEWTDPRSIPLDRPNLVSTDGFPGR